MGLFDRKCLNDEKIRGFNNYKYTCIDNSPISVYISHPFWNWFVNFYPKWLAPNFLTFTGAILIMGCFFFVVLMDWSLDSNSFGVDDSKNIPNWVWLVCSYCTFIAHLLDGTDGKQARRVGASGPTGELFDHGLDSWSTIPFTLTIFSLFGKGVFSVPALRLLLILISVQLVFVVTHWEKYNTGILFLSWGYDASQYGLSLFYLIAYFYGHKIFQIYLIDNVTFAQCFEFSFYACCVLSLLMSFYNLYYSYFVDKTGIQPNFYEFILPLVSPIGLFAISVVWAVYSPMNIIELSPRLFCWTMGTVFSNITVHLIINQMSSTRVRVLNKLLLLYFFIALFSITGLFGELELILLKILAFFVTSAHIIFGVCVVRQLCDHFKINAFSLKYLIKQNT